MNNDSIQKILLLAANPIGSRYLRLGEEMREIEEGLKRSKNRERYSLATAQAVRYRDIHRAILEHEPQIIHFSGHGAGEEGLVFEDETGAAKLVDAEALAGLFQLFSGQVQCVVLNACYSQVQAQAISQHIPCVIGMKKAIGDRAAIEFAVGFYDALGAKKSYEFAYNLGCNAIRMTGISEQDIPTLLKTAQIESMSAKTQPLQLASSPVSTKAITSQRVFISYRSQQPDAGLAQEFYNQLVAAGHEAFMAAASISWGQNWVERIDEELKRCDYFLLLLSEQSASSDMVAGEVRTARKLQDKLGKPVILPVRVNLPFDDPLNYELRSFLQTIQQRQWKSQADTPVILSEILALLSTGSAPQPVAEEITPTPIVVKRDRPPLPVAELELPGGTIQLASRFYVQREPWESRSLEQIEKNAGLIRIKAPRQMGKTSLLARICHHATELGYRTATLDFLETDETIFEDLTVFLKRFCALISRKLGISPRKVSEFWDEELFGPKENCNDYFEQCILVDLTVPLFLGLDELDRLFPYNAVAKEFLALLRSWNEKAKVNETWAKLRMAIAHSTESYVVMDTNSSPFNVGLAVELPEFNQEQVLDLVARHGLSWGTEETRQLMEMVGGHPYLVRLALYHIAQGDLTLTQLVATASTDAGIYGEHLRRHLWNLQQNPELAAAFQKVVATDKPVCLPSMSAFKLNGMGLVSLQGNEVIVRHESLYRPYFQSRLRIRE
ncbi:AAA-like domain-containing protein [Nostoc punctiforme FACHB-252]|uniref:AAA-like domain-containing protein n=1 Tax=Nostoc punctiforme FACHB-252 TaxID=1357509 RepID=A0ABR8HK66_NOSPU|nr:AAA-like domain-containing protein [Nostoc punctiforme]MBD2616219.1 AAA-like domain-containing protein [Nostoc punctiforme FACHB-252]